MKDALSEKYKSRSDVKTSEGKLVASSLLRDLMNRSKSEDLLFIITDPIKEKLKSNGN